MSSRGLHLVVLIAWLASACADPEVAPDTGTSVLAEPVALYRIRDRIEASGELVAKARARVAAQVEGQVTRIARAEGVSVAAGDVIVELDPERRELEQRSETAQLAEVRAQLAEAERDLRRIERLHGQGVASSARLDEAQTAVRLARARCDAAAARGALTERAVRDSSVKAPFAGLLLRRLANEGEFVAVGDPLFEIVALDPLEVEFHLPEGDSARAAPGSPLEIQVAPHPGEVFPALVTMVAPALDPGSRTLRVKGEVPNSAHRLRPGLFARVVVDLGERTDVAMIPREAVLQRADGSVVFRLNGSDRAERRVVRLGASVGERVEVIEGVAPGDWILVRGHSRLVDGARVSLRDPEGRPSSEKPPEAASLAAGDTAIELVAEPTP
jgi:membrane fusion protein (multidrug efflux system)